MKHLIQELGLLLVQDRLRHQILSRTRCVLPVTASHDYVTRAADSLRVIFTSLSRVLEHHFEISRRFSQFLLRFSVSVSAAKSCSHVTSIAFLNAPFFVLRYSPTPTGAYKRNRHSKTNHASTKDEKYDSSN